MNHYKGVIKCLGVYVVFGDEGDLGSDKYSEAKMGVMVR